MEDIPKHISNSNQKWTRFYINQNFIRQEVYNGPKSFSAAKNIFLFNLVMFLRQKYSAIHSELYSNISQERVDHF